MSNETNCSNERNCDTCKWSNEPCHNSDELRVQCIQENYADWQPKTPDKSCENCEYQDDIFCDNPIGKCKDMEKVENWTPIKDQTPLETDKVLKEHCLDTPYCGVVKRQYNHIANLEQQVKDLKERLAEAVRLLSEHMDVDLQPNLIERTTKFLAESKEVEK